MENTNNPHSLQGLTSELIEKDLPLTSEIRRDILDVLKRIGENDHSKPIHLFKGYYYVKNLCSETLQALTVEETSSGVEQARKNLLSLLPKD